MNERSKKGKLKLKSNRSFNEKIHFNIGNEWTTQEIKQIKEDNVHTLTELGEILGRTPNGVSSKRYEIRIGKFDSIFN